MRVRKVNKKKKSTLNNNSSSKFIPLIKDNRSSDKKMRRITQLLICKILLSTSLACLLVNIALVVFYSDCSKGPDGWGCRESGEDDFQSRDNGTSEEDLFRHNVIDVPQHDSKNEIIDQQYIPQEINITEQNYKSGNASEKRRGFMDVFVPNAAQIFAMANKFRTAYQNRNIIQRNTTTMLLKDYSSDKMNHQVINNDLAAVDQRDSRESHESKQDVFVLTLKEPSDATQKSWDFVYPQNILTDWDPKPPVPQKKGLPGEMGKAVALPPESKEKMLEAFKLNEFNVLASDMISVNRSLPDVRKVECQLKSYSYLLPTTSIIIVFHNEAWSTLLRTLWSIINRTPTKLLKEIILVDDASQREYLGKKLENFISTLPVPTKLLRTGVRSGLIRARMLGAAEASGLTLTFLDAHIECTQGWLEPLLARINENRSRVVCPIINSISQYDFSFARGTDQYDMFYGGFDWKIDFRWYAIPEREKKRRMADRTMPLLSPTMAGGLFTIDKAYFIKLGKYDEGMEIWGGENIEMSFRIWQCGGSLEIVPCSCVGHIFREKSPYTFPGGVNAVILKNKARVAHVWMDEWKEFLFKVYPGVKVTNPGDVSARIKLRQDLKCKSFKWYLTKIFPESQLPLEYFYLGDIRNPRSQNCLDTLGKSNGANLGVTRCHGLGGNQLFLYTKTKQIISYENCLDSTKAGSTVEFARCHSMQGNQMWIYDKKDGSLKNSRGECLEAPSLNQPQYPTMKRCDSSDAQKWIMEHPSDWKKN